MTEQAGKFLGLIKFFREEWKLDSLINGCFYCNTPEFYRMSGDEGVSDKFESCVFSYRTSRNDEPVTLNVNGIDLNDVLGLTVHNGGDGDAWMHCWYALWVPKDQADLDETKANIERMQSEFGKLYAFIPAREIKTFHETLSKLTDKPISCKEVVYSSDKEKWGTFCKSLSYAYQREYRFSIGECEPHNTTEYIITSTDGFSDVIVKNPKIQLQHNTTGQVWLEISAD